MEEQASKDTNRRSNISDRSSENASSEPAVRSRWTPKPEQILILESIFNSGMVNPPKEETVRIRKLLEKFGSVGDANVFYWFQNRRSRSRRRQRQLAQATLEVQQQQQQQQQQQHQQQQAFVGTIEFASSTNSTAHDSTVATDYEPNSSSGFTFLGNSSFHGALLGDNEHHHGLEYMNGTTNYLFEVSGGKMSLPIIEQNSTVPSVLYPQEVSDMHFQSGFITVFINGLATEVPKGPIDLKPMFGQDVILVHSSGVPLATNEYGILQHCLQPGESYFLVPRPLISS